ncbi:MAG: hypothetical protein LC808_24210 [Actinobacteria bacterium]|nr:hypothetical protein [Actinomycetota bacterium]
MKSVTELDWVTWDFRAVGEPGWRAVYLDFDGLGLSARPLAGWLIQEQDAYSYPRETEESAATVRPSRRVVPARCDGMGEIKDATKGNTFWLVLGPGEPGPTVEQQLIVRAERDLLSDGLAAALKDKLDAQEPIRLGEGPALGPGETNRLRELLTQ